MLGLVDLILKTTDLGIEAHVQYPEGHLHPSAQVKLGDLLIHLQRRPHANPDYVRHVLSLAHDKGCSMIANFGDPEVKCDCHVGLGDEADAIDAKLTER